MRFGKKALIGTMAVWSLALFGCGGNDPAPANAEPITEAAAKQIALEHAGLSESEVQFVRVELDRDNGRSEYEIEFTKDGVEYDYDIDVNTGEIVSYDQDAEYYPSTASNSATPNNADVITEQAAKDAALSHAGFNEDDVVFSKVRLDYDDGRAEYEIEFFKDGAEYDYDIDAVTGEVRAYDVDTRNPVAPANLSDATFITEAEAKTAAVNHAGLNEADVTFLKVKLDYDDGRAEYEIEFYTDGTEYDYNIDAVTGEVLSFDVDKDMVAPVQASNAAPTTAPAPVNNSEYITEAAAKAAALNHAGINEGDATFLRVQFDYDDGRAEYEVEFNKDGVEYDYEIDAVTGEVISYDVDRN